jgi:hypothetical protein
VTAPAPWRCPDCLTWIAPHATEHRCDPDGGSEVTSIAPVPHPPGSGGADRMTASPGTVTYSFQARPGNGPDDFARWRQAAHRMARMNQITEMSHAGIA